MRHLGIGLLVCALAGLSTAHADAPADSQGADGLALVPPDVPSKRWGRKLYTEQLCDTCHGDDGSANTELAKKLVPPPTRFLDAQRVAAVSPQRAFNAITHGVEGTAMAKFGHLGEMERWSLAFYVLSMRHEQARAERGKLTAGLLSSMPDHSAQALAGMTDQDLIARIGLADPEARLDVLAYFRALSPFEKPSAQPIASNEARYAPEAPDAPENVGLGVAVGLGALLVVALVLRMIGQRLKASRSNEKPPPR